MQPRHPHFLQRFVPIALGVAVANGASAAQWTTSAAVTPALTYTDNACLSRDNEQGEWIGLVTPSGSIGADGNRANFSVSASTEVNTLTDSRLENMGCNPSGFSGDREQFTPRLNGNADAVLVDNWLYIDANARIDQNSASPFVSGGDDSLNRTGNTNTTYSYSVSPYISRRFKDTAVLNLRYTWDDQYNTADIVGESSSQSAQVTVGSVPGVSKFTWGLQGDYSKVKYNDTPGRETNDESELKSAQLNLGYQLNRSWQVNGFYGEEWNDFISFDDDIDGSYWDAGLRWTPNPRTTVDAGTGHRFYGDSPRFSITHRHKRSVLSAKYAKTLTYDRDLRTLDSGNEFDPVGNPTALSNSPTLDERYTLKYSYQGRRSRLGISASHSEQTTAEFFQGSAFKRESVFKNLSVSLNHSLYRNLSLTGRVSWEEEEPKGQRNTLIAQSETWRASIGAQRPLSTNTTLSLDYQYTDRQSDTVFNEYQENRITLSLRIDL